MTQHISGNLNKGFSHVKINRVQNLTTVDTPYYPIEGKRGLVKQGRHTTQNRYTHFFRLYRQGPMWSICALNSHSLADLMDEIRGNNHYINDCGSDAGSGGDSIASNNYSEKDVDMKEETIRQRAVLDQQVADAARHEAYLAGLHAIAAEEGRKFKRIQLEFRLLCVGGSAVLFSLIKDVVSDIRR